MMNWVEWSVECFENDGLGDAIAKWTIPVGETFSFAHERKVDDVTSGSVKPKIKNFQIMINRP